jgi:cytochrome c-type biogenesis protein
MVRHAALGIYGAAALSACAQSDAYRPLEVGDAAPEFAARMLDGSHVSLAELRGKVVLLNVWATWCVPCRKEMPALQQLYQDLGDEGLVVLAVSVDAAGARDAVDTFVNERGIGFDIALDPSGGVQETFRTMGVPESFLIDRDGKIVRRWIGEFDPGSEDTRSSVEEALGR